ncbi:DUF1934 domain-containing protein [Clostridium cylindrosporum]|uniref:Calycin-like domain-containing protein n=1 Tax=Clostridium cylindrosporum DSM 605 TaxID=1121307 RepID=A0A0J8G572_CLOCY|nr:DUF1934 domain-containing protein [Clostridium cylindrosporum]KMT22811.1 hypothetical protein CLCY_5c00500 [Clostridium cylindrosporum DSM 605]
MKSKSKKVMITVKTIQSFGEEVEEIELVTEGLFSKLNDIYIAEYEESEISGMKGTKTSIKIGSDEVNLFREGTTTSHLLFKLGNDHISLYGTEHGAFEVVVKPGRVSIDVNECGGRVELDYIIETQGTNISENKLVLTIEEIN